MSSTDEQELHPEIDYATSLIQAIDLTGSKKALRRRFEPSCLIAAISITIVMIATAVAISLFVPQLLAH